MPTQPRKKPKLPATKILGPFVHKSWSTAYWSEDTPLGHAMLCTRTLAQNLVIPRGTQRIYVHLSRTKVPGAIEISFPNISLMHVHWSKHQVASHTMLWDFGKKVRRFIGHPDRHIWAWVECEGEA